MHYRPCTHRQLILRFGATRTLLLSVASCMHRVGCMHDDVRGMQPIASSAAAVSVRPQRAAAARREVDGDCAYVAHMVHLFWYRAHNVNKKDFTHNVTWWWVWDDTEKFIF